MYIIIFCRKTLDDSLSTSHRNEWGHVGIAIDQKILRYKKSERSYTNKGQETCFRNSHSVEKSLHRLIILLFSATSNYCFLPNQ